MSRVVLFNKPFRVMSQFREAGDKTTLAAFFDDPALRVAGRLDYDSEGLMVLSDDGRLVQRVTHPKNKRPKTYWAQVEGEPTAQALDSLRRGVTLNDGPTRPARVRSMQEPDGLWDREPPIRYRANIPTTWLELTITEGRNRQVRRMTAAVGFPTLRLVRARVGDWALDGLRPGQWRELPATRR
ncbi:pseudouridine synthase [Marinihelvus fidelis]|uniref:Pseudouridine synthase n=1 Tax=Marinihelvus fidelis TaxID=2613842 RepID=A0A5N0TDK2_9GAMM|nr:pseudouridine synthase [Marinihelvus fidelis]KAA9132771.1 pseudouridine synthase [Marinihelvus fidelis]